MRTRPKYYCTGKRLCQILHTRLRANCSNLNYYLFYKYITDSPLCRCGNAEDAYHYFFECRMYTHQRILLFDSASQYHVITLNLLLFGDPTLSLEENTHIFDKVQKYISYDMKAVTKEWSIAEKFHACRGNQTRSSRIKIQCSNHWAKVSTPWGSRQRLNIYLEAMRNLPRQIIERRCARSYHILDTKWY